MDFYFSNNFIIVEDEFDGLNGVIRINESGIVEYGYIDLDSFVYRGIIFQEA